MAFVEPQYTKGQVNRAGQILVNPEAYSLEERVWADMVLANWRACHGYPINTFQALLRLRLKGIDVGSRVIMSLLAAGHCSKPGTCCED